MHACRRKRSNGGRFVTKPGQEGLDINEMNDGSSDTCTITAPGGEQNGDGHEQSYETVGVAGGIPGEHGVGQTE